MADVAGAIVQNLLAMRAQIEAQAALIDGTLALLSAGVAATGSCPHPAEQREDLTSMGEEAGSHWRCRVCGHEEAPNA